MLWDDLRSLDYLVSRPDVDPRRIACVGLSVGGYRSFVLAALDPRIKAAVAVGWMSSFGTHIRRHVVNSIGLSFHIVGLYRYLDLPDLAALIAPRSVLVINGSKDQLFPPEGVKAAFERSNGASGRQAYLTGSNAGSTTRPTSSMSECRQRRGSGWNGVSHDAPSQASAPALVVLRWRVFHSA